MFTSMHLLKKALQSFLTILLLLNSPAAGSQEDEHKTVLILYSLGHVFPATAKWDQSIRTVFRTQQDIIIKVNTEHLDLSRYNDSDYIRMMMDIFRYKYLESKPDLIIAVFDPAYDFVLKYGQELFPGIPILFGGTEQPSFENSGLDSNITGVFHERTSYSKTLELALNLQPDTRNVFVVAGAGFMEQTFLMSGRKMFQQYADRLEFTYVTALSLDDIQNRVKKLPPHTIVLYFPLLEPKDGKVYIAVNALSNISEASSVPVYSFWEVMLGHGMVGGYLENLPDQAKTTAEMGLRILGGTPPGDIPAIRKRDLNYIVDWRQLKRWSIPEHRLPPGSIVRFKELTFWDRYKGRIIGALAVVLFQTLIISYLLYQRRIRRKVEQNYRTVADYTYDWEYWQNPDGSLQYVSPSCESICGYSARELISNPSLLQEMIVLEDQAAWNEHRCSVQRDWSSGEIQFRIQKPDGDIRWIEHACQPVYDNQGNNQGIRASNRDITVRKQSEESLKASRQEAELLTGKLLNAQEAERARVARELHDDITQRLAVMNIEVDNLEMQNRSLPEPLREKLRQLGTNLGDLSSDIHMISRQLHPSILYDLGLVKAIETECHKFAQLRGISPALDLDEDIKNVPREIALCIYRILQGGLRNIGKHAEASNIQVRLYKENNTICFFLKDNGMGFNPAAAKERAGIGLASMEERARLINGALSIESSPGKGTTIELKVAVTSDSIG